MNDADKIVTFESYYDPMLAHIVRTRLEASGIACFIADENTLGLNPLYNQAAGGIKLKVFERDLERCHQILASDDDLHEQDIHEIDGETDNYVICPFCASTSVSNMGRNEDESLFATFANLANPFYSPKNWHCNNCRQEFE